MSALILNRQVTDSKAKTNPPKVPSTPPNLNWLGIKFTAETFSSSIWLIAEYEITLRLKIRQPIPIVLLV